MSRLRQTNEQKAGKQNTSQTLTGYYGSSSKKSKAKKKRDNPGRGY